MTLLDSFFGCHHKRHTFPLTIRGKARRCGVVAITGTYVVCLDCGKEFLYDWNEMKLVRSEQRASRGGDPIALLLNQKLR